MFSNSTEEVLLYFSIKYNGDFVSIYKALEKHEKIDKDEYENITCNLNCKYTTMMSADYPKSLKDISYPPFVLFYYGDLSLLDDKTIGVIGMKVPSEYGVNATDKLVKDLVKKDYTIVSGMALGIDTMAHRSAMKNHGKTIAVLGSGIEYCFPKKNKCIYDMMKESHLIISEYPGNCLPDRENFPRTNRIIAGLSNALLVTESRNQSGTMITVGYALEQGKDIFCVPSRIYDNLGCNKLIQQGAKLVNCINDIIEG